MGLLLRMAMSQDAELALNGFTAIKATLRNEVLKKEFVTLGGLSSLCRSIRALDPNVQNAAATLLGGFLYEFPDPTQLGLTKPQKQDMFQATAQMGFQFYEFGNQDLAILAFQVALKLSPNNPELLTQIGILQVGSSDLQDRVAGRQKLQKALRAGPGAVRTCFFLADSITKELHTRFPEDWKTLPESREQLKNSMKLLENSLSQLRRGKPTNSGVVEKDAIHPLTSNVFSLLVSLCTVLDREGEALKYANEWSLRDTNSTFAHTTYAKLLIDAGRSQEAYQLLQRTHNFDPDKPDVPFLMAQALVREQKYKEALECVDSSISLYEHNKVLIDRNVAREAARKKKLAEKEGEKDKDKKKKKKKTSEEDEEPQVSRDSVLCEHGKEQASILKSRIHYKLGEYQQALEAIDGVAETQPLGKLLARATTVPTKPRIHLLAGQTLLKMKQYEAGFERFEQACDTWLQTTCNVGDAQCKQYFDTHPTDLALLNKLGQMCVSSSSESGEAAEITAKQKMCTKYTALAQIAPQ
jgi:tetratricopeptide (TPR) repeat protein